MKLAHASVDAEREHSLFFVRSIVDDESRALARLRITQDHGPAFNGVKQLGCVQAQDGRVAECKDACLRAVVRQDSRVEHLARECREPLRIRHTDRDASGRPFTHATTGWSESGIRVSSRCISCMDSM